MAVSVTMPRLGESVSEGTVTRWLKKEGEQVEADEPLLEVSTDKVDTEIPAPASGVLKRISVAEDETVEVGVELAVIDSEGDAGAAPQAEKDTEGDQPREQEPDQESEQESEQSEQPEPEAEPEPETAAAPEPEAEPDSEPEAEPAARADGGDSEAARPTPAPAAPESGDGGPYVTPLVRKLAAEHSVDLSALSGSGVGGRIRKQDVLEAASRQGGDGRAASAEKPETGGRTERTTAAPTRRPAPSSTPVSVRGRTEKLSRLRAVIAARMVESLSTSAQLTTVVEADVSRIAALRARARAGFEAREGVKLTFLPFFALACVEALKTHPQVNSSVDVDAGTITYHDSENLGIAVDTERGLLVPVIHEAGDLNLAGLARKIADLAERTRAGQVTPDELGGGTFTLTNTGSRGALFDTPIINQPQVGILGTGAVVKRPVVVEDAELGEVIAVRSTVYLALTYDHRVVDGADAARFLSTVKERLEDGAFEAELGR